MLVLGWSISLATEPNSSMPEEPPSRFTAPKEVQALSVVMNPTRYKVMYEEMNHAVAEVARRYGNPPFTQIQTNEREKATAIRKRLADLDRHEALTLELEQAEQQLAQVRDQVKRRTEQLARVEENLVRTREELNRAESTLRDLRNRIALPAEAP